MPKRKITIRITKELPGLNKGTERTVDSTVAIDMVNRGKAEFVDEGVAEEIAAKKAKIATISNDAMKKTASKKKAVGKVDRDLKKKREKDAEANREHHLKMALGRRKYNLEKYGEYIDLKSKEYALTVDTTQEEFDAMLETAKAAMAEADRIRLLNQANADAFESRKETLSAYGESANIDALTEQTTEEEFQILLTEAIEKHEQNFKEEQFKGRTEQLSEFGEFADLSALTVDTTDEEFTIMLNAAKTAKEGSESNPDEDSKDGKTGDNPEEPASNTSAPKASTTPAGSKKGSKK